MVRERLNARLPDWAEIGFFTLRLKTNPDFYRTKRFVFEHEEAFRTFFTYGSTALYGLIGLMGINLLAILGAIPSNTLTTLPSFLWEVAPVQFNPTGIAILIAAGIPIVALHELGHVLAAFAYRIDTKSVGLVLLLGILPIYAYVEQDFDPRTERDPREQLRVSTAGITMQFVLGVITVPLIALILGGLPPLATPTGTILSVWAFTFFMINIQLAIINAFPIQLLDGGTAYWSLACLTGEALTGKKDNSLTNFLLGLRTLVVVYVIVFIFF